MIKVPFVVDGYYQAKNSNEISLFLQQYQDMPWLTYLLKNARKITSVKTYKPAEHLYVVDFMFELDPKKETYYYLKFS